VNVCTGVPTTLAEACALIADAMGKVCPAEVVGGHRVGDMRHCLGDSSEITRLLQRQPVPPNEGLRLTFSRAPA
jgi:hypothetical protein